MHISAISSCYGTNNKYSQQNFKSLIKDKSVTPIINSLSGNDILELKQIEERLSLTKFWDMKISCLSEKFNEFKFEFIDKRKKHGVISDGIYPYNKEDNTIKIYSVIYGPANMSQNALETLRFESKERADAIFDEYSKNLEYIRHKNFNLTPIESLKSKEIELNMLEEAAYYAKKTDKVKNIETGSTLKANVGNNLY